MIAPIHGVCVSVGYADYLDVSLSHNLPLLATCVVATSPDDRETQRVAGKHGCQVIITEDGRRSGGTFNKGRMIERALQQLPQGGWRIHFDADIVMPGNTLQRLAVALHDEASIYGCDRMNVVGWDAWQRLLSTGWAARGWEHQHFLNYSINRAEIGGRLIYGDQGWVPIGFWQCWHSSAEYSGIYRTRSYPTGSNSAAHDDVQFALRWDRAKRIFVPELLLAHLVTGDSRYAANWNGRRTMRFGPEPTDVVSNVGAS